MTTDNWINLIAAILIGGGTLALAFMTWKSIRQTRSIQRAEKKERLLNEIIMWLKELENRIFPSHGRIMSREMQEEIEYKEKLGLSLETWQSLMHLDESLTQLNSLESEIKEGEYIKKIASGLNSDLGRLIEVTLGYLNERKNLVLTGAQYPHTISDRNEKEDALITELIEDDTKSLEGLTLSESGRNSVLLGRNAGAIRKSILNAVDKVVEIKASLL